jgi:acetyl-CoA carboxylase biotin carboxyl carrier protein
MEVVERVRQLIEMMADHDLAEMEIEEGELRIKITRTHKPEAPAAGPPTFAYTQMPPQQLPTQQPQLQAGGEPQIEEAGAPAGAGQENLTEITSPMVGTFYRTSSPGADPYVQVGSEVESDSVVCIIEAMKVMNEIKADCEGEIVEILVEDAEPVEYGQVLFLVEPAEE